MHTHARTNSQSEEEGDGINRELFSAASETAFSFAALFANSPDRASFLRGLNQNGAIGGEAKHKNRARQLLSEDRS